jgi:Zn-dependent metalloprotease
MVLTSSVHAGTGFMNAFWNGRQMVYGDGDGVVFDRFTKSLDVIGHELTHGVIAFECDLEYHDQPGALNEHFADVFGTMVRQKKLAHDVDTADWLIGSEIIVQTDSRRALRSLSSPGSAFQNDPFLGDDPQPKHMTDYDPTSLDYGGVHINSGIPNYAFYLAARAVGGNSWDHVGKVWYGAMRALTSTSDFGEMAATSRALARAYTAHPAVGSAVDEAWTAVGL